MFRLNTEISANQNQVSAMKAAIMDRQDAFKTAVDNASKDCTLANVLTTLSTVVTIASGIASGIGAIGSIAAIASGTAKLSADFLSKVDQIGPWISPEKWKEVINGDNGNIIKQINSVKNHTGQFTEQIDTFKKAFLAGKGTANNLLAFTFDSSGGAAEQKAKFIEQMKDYIGKYPEALAYQDEVIRFIDFCDLTNQKRQEFTRGFLMVLSCQNQMEQLNLDNANFSSLLLKTDAARVESTSKVLFLDSYLNAKQFLLKLLHIQSKFIGYFMLKPEVFNPGLYDYGIVGLNSAYINANQSRLLNYLSDNSAGRSLDSLTRPITLSAKKDPEGFKRFIKGQTVGARKVKKHIYNFKINPIRDYYLDGQWSEIYIIRAKVFIKGAKTDSDFISFNLSHQGDATFITGDRKKVFFSHKPVLKSLTYKLSTNAYDPKNEFSGITGDFKIAGTNPYVGISPFASWNLEIDEDVPLNDGLSLSKVEHIELLFDFYFKPFESEALQ